MDRSESVLPRLIRGIKNHRPRQIQDLWSNADTPIALNHISAHLLHDWVTEAEIEDLLGNEKELKEIIFILINELASLGMTIQANDQIENGIIIVPECMGCSLTCDAGFSHDRNLVKAPHIPALHSSIIKLTILTLLLKHPKSGLLVSIMTREFPTWMRTSEERGMYMEECLHNKEPQGFLGVLIGNLDNLECFPKLCHLSGGLLSLLITRRTAVSFDLIGEVAFVESISKYLQMILPMVHCNSCIVDEYSGVVAFLNILPVLYLTATWPRVRYFPKSRIITSVLFEIIIDIFEVIAGDDLKYDAQPDLSQLPEAFSAQILIVPLLEKQSWRKDLILKHPLSFAVIAGIEVLGWYSYHHVSLDMSLPTNEHCDSGLIRDTLQADKGNIQELIERVPEYAYIEPILEALILNDKAPFPDAKVSLLNEPLLDDNKCCGFYYCRKTNRDIGKELQKCGGGCGGLEYYCCREHQKKHWGYHKNFCTGCKNDNEKVKALFRERN